jgi:predicted enzyme related to lactoylglutathione lyase
MGNAFVHIELATDDVAAAKKFYKSIFDWKLSDMMGYTMLDVGKGGTGGGMTKKQMAGQATAWTPYVAVADVNETIEKARAAGAHIIAERTEIGGGMGAFGMFVDPTGAPLGVWEMAKAAPKKSAKKPAKKAAKKPAKKKGKR